MLDLEGVQTSEWWEKYETVDEDENDNPIVRHCDGSGTERISFATPEPIKVKVKVKAARPHFAFPPENDFKNPVFAVTADVERNVTWRATDGCGPSIYPKESCQVAAPTNWWLGLSHYKLTSGRSVVLVDDGKRNEQDDVEAPVAGCEYRKFSWFPALSFLDNDSHIIDAPFNSATLLKRGRESGKAEGKLVDDNRPDDYWTTELTWKYSLKRVGR